MNFKMMNIGRKHKIAAVVVLLAVGLLLIINSTTAKKYTPSVSSGTKVEKPVKTAKPANKKTKITDSNQLSDSNKPAGKAKAKKSVLAVSSKAGDKKTAKNGRPANKKIRIADSNQTADVVEFKKPAEAVLAHTDSDSLLADSKKATDSKVTVIDNNQTAAKTEELADSNVPLNSKAVEDSNKLLAAILSQAKFKQVVIPDAQPKQAALSTNLGDVRAEIQSLLFARNIPITDALQLLGARYGKNIIPSAKISGNLNFSKLNNVNFDDAMKAILGDEFTYQQEGNLVRVYAASDVDGLKTKGSGMICKVFTLYYISASEAQKLVKSALSASGKIEITTDAELGVPINETITSPRGGGNTMALNDMMIIYDYPEQVEQVEKIIAAIDTRPKQVLIEATILTATLTEGMQLGIDWQNLTNAAITGITGLNSASHDFIGFGGTSTNTGKSIAGGVTIGVVRGDLAAFIRAVEEVTDVTILANPKILATNKQLGQVYIGTKVAYESQTTQTDTTTTSQVSFLDTGTKLSFRPYIGNDGYIRMDIHPKDSSATLRVSGTTTMPDETSAELVTNIIVRDGETIVIGGLFREKRQTSNKQVPMLGNLPVIGAAFSSKADEAKREEVIVLLTPHIIGEPNQTGGAERAEDVARQVMGATEELHPANKIKLAEEHYNKAAIYYAKGENSRALKELNYAIELSPTYIEAIQLKEKISNATDPEKKPVRKIIEQAKQPQSSNWRRR